MNEKSLNTLEYNKILQMLSTKAISPMGKEISLQLKPICDLSEIKQRQQQTTEAVTLILKKGSLPLGGIKDIRSSLKRASIGGVLSIFELLHISDFLYVCKKVISYSKNERKNDYCEMLDPMFETIEMASALEREITRCIVNEQQLADDASSNLFSIRRGIRSAHDKIKEQLNSILHSQSYKNMLQDAVITIRSERYCVPVKQEYKGSFPGMIHDQSSSGATIFMEPMSVIVLNNKIKELLAEEKTEIEKILKNLSMLVADHSDLLFANLETLTELDFIFAKGELSISMFGTEPIFNSKGYINIIKGRHPLLNEKTVVPTNIYMGKDYTTLLITGPNTGGKTVTLKTVGLFTLMGQAGLHISAFDHSELAVFDDVYADIGDEQSIEQSLSTFSSHMSNIVKILNEITNNSLVLLDELGAGTDPTEGAALAIAILRYLHSRKIRALVTTHYSELKVYALSTDGVENASCEFDIVTLRPTYKLLIGIPGKSNAFEISRKLLLPEHIIESAKEVLSHEDKRFEDVITDLEISRKSVILEQERAEQFRREALKLKSEFEKERDKLNDQKEKFIRKAKEDAMEIMQKAKEEADALIRDMHKQIRERYSQKDLDATRQKIKDKVAELYEDVSDYNKPKKNPNKATEKLHKGDKVYVETIRQSAILINEPDANGEVMIQAGVMKMKMHISNMYLDESKGSAPIKKSNSKNVKIVKAQNLTSEVDLRGLMVDEALEKTDKFLDDSYLSNLEQVTIIHGKGTGALRNAIHNYLRNHPHVKSYRIGQFGEGDNGVTIAFLK